MERDSKGRFVKGMEVIFTKAHRQHLSEAAIGNKNSRSYRRKGLTHEQIFGKEKAEEMREQNRLANLGKSNPIKGLTLEQAYGIDKANRIRKNMSQSDMGRTNYRKGITNVELYGEEKAQKMSEKHSQFMSGRTGPNSSHWKGGITPKNRLIRTSKKYQEWRLAVFQRDNFTCQKCGRRGGDLEPHHSLSFSEFPELRFELWNGITLCSKCHSEIDKNRYIKIKNAVQQGS